MKRTPIQRKTALKPVSPKKRSRAGKVTGTVRLEGKDKSELRERVGNRDGWTCRNCGIRCWRYWEEGNPLRYKPELFHEDSQGAGGADTEENTHIECQPCHYNFHQYGPSRQKPCPAKK